MMLMPTVLFGYRPEWLILCSLGKACATANSVIGEVVVSYTFQVERYLLISKGGDHALTGSIPAQVSWLFVTRGIINAFHSLSYAMLSSNFQRLPPPNPDARKVMHTRETDK